MKILLIGNKETSLNPEEYYQEYLDFFKLAADQSNAKPDLEFTLVGDLYIAVGDDEFSIYDTRHDCDISSYDLVLIRGKGFRDMFDVVKTISVYIKKRGKIVINDYSEFRDSSKLTQALQFYTQGIPVAKSVLATESVLAGKHELGFGFPCIMKATFGAHGNDNYLVKSLEEARDIATKNGRIRFVLQRFVPNDGDFRLLVIGDKVLVIGREAVEGSHLNNTSQGGSAVLRKDEEIPQKVIDDAIKITKHLNMTFSGVDVIADRETGEYFSLEVNSQPQLMSGAFVDKKAEAIAHYFDSL